MLRWLSGLARDMDKSCCHSALTAHAFSPGGDVPRDSDSRRPGVMPTLSSH